MGLGFKSSLGIPIGIRTVLAVIFTASAAVADNLEALIALGLPVLAKFQPVTTIQIKHFTSEIGSRAAA